MASSSTMTSTDSLCKEPEAEVNGSGHVLQSSQSAGDLFSKQQQLNAGTLCKIKYRNVMSIFDNKSTQKKKLLHVYNVSLLIIYFRDTLTSDTDSIV
jgi:hypothetical protein